MPARQRRFNYKVNFEFSNEDATTSEVNAVEVEVPDYNRPVIKYRNQRKSNILIPAKEDPQEFTITMDLDVNITNDDQLAFGTGGTSTVLADLESMADLDSDTVTVTVSAIERIDGSETTTWQFVAEDCMVTNLTADTFASQDDSEVARTTVTLMPTRVTRVIHLPSSP